MNELIRPLMFGDTFFVDSLIHHQGTEDTVPEMEDWADKKLTVCGVENWENAPFSKHEFFYSVTENDFFWGDFHMNIPKTNELLLSLKTKLSEPSLPHL